MEQVIAPRAAMGRCRVPAPNGTRSIPMLGAGREPGAVTSHGSAPCTAGIGLVMRLVVTVRWKQPLLKPQYLGHLI